MQSQAVPSAAAVVLQSEEWSRKARARMDEEEARFLRVFSRAEEGNSPLVEWVQTYYRIPRPDLLLGALAHMMKVPGAGVGPAAFPFSVFLSSVLPQRVASVDAVRGLLQAMHAVGGNASLANNEKMDTLLRALHLAHQPTYDTVLEGVSDTFQAQARSGATDCMPRDEQEFLIDAVTSLDPNCPASLQLQRLPLLEWPIPSMDMSKFEHHVRRYRYPLYAGSRYLLAHLNAAHKLSVTDPATFSLFSPVVASMVTKSLVDAYWAGFYATGAHAFVHRVLDVGTPYMEFMEEYSDKPVTEYDAAEAAQPLPASLPPEFESDPFSALRFETSRYALWTLLMNGSTHVRVVEAFLQQYSDISDRVALMDPISRNEDFTAFGRQRLDLMRALLPSMQHLGMHADEHGIGSGEWPAGYLHDKSHLEAPVLLGTSSALVSSNTATTASATTAVDAEAASDVPPATLSVNIFEAPTAAATPLQGSCTTSASVLSDIAARDRRQIVGMRRR